VEKKNTPFSGKTLVLHHIHASRDPARGAGRQPTPVNGTVPGRCGPSGQIIVHSTHCIPVSTYDVTYLMPVFKPAQAI